MRIGFVKIIIICFCLFFLVACSRGGADDRVVVAGSTSVQPYAEILAEAFAGLHPDIDIDVQGGGSSAGITAVASGVADIGMSSRALKESETGFFVIEIAKDGLAIIVNPKNQITRLTLEQVQGIYTAEITNWSELGGSDAKIHVITREEGSGTRGAFEELVMAEGKFITPRAIVQDSNGSVRQLVAGDPNSIGFISLGLVDETVQALELNGVAATAENVKTGSYSLFRPFLFLTLDEPDGATKQFIDFVLSPDGRKILTDEGLIAE